MAHLRGDRFLMGSCGINAFSSSSLIATLKAGVRYTDYHLQMHQRIARLLLKFGLVKGLTEEALVAENLTGPFMPHGLGHPLGLQVHDVAGFMQDDRGTHLAAPAHYPYLRCTRVLEPGMVISMEPMLTIADGEPGAGGYREHDILVITEDGAEDITHYPYGPVFNVVG